MSTETSPPLPPTKGFTNWRETGRFGHAIERVLYLWKRGRPPAVEELIALRDVLRDQDPRHEVGPYLRRIDRMFLRHPAPRSEDWMVQRLGDRVALRARHSEYLLEPDDARRIGRELSAAAGATDKPGESQRVLADVDERDAEATRRLAILDALVSNYGSSVETQVEAVLKKLVRESVSWAFARLYEEQGR